MVLLRTDLRELSAAHGSPTVDVFELSELGVMDTLVFVSPTIDVLDEPELGVTDTSMLLGTVGTPKTEETEAGRLTASRLRRAPVQNTAVPYKTIRSDVSLPLMTFEGDGSLTCGTKSVEMQLNEIVAEVVAYYGVEVVAVAVLRSCGTELLAKHGLDVQHLKWNDEGTCGRSFDFFRHSVARNLPIIIEDTAKDARVRHDPLVTGGPRIRFYASAPVDYAIGLSMHTLSIASSTPRSFSLADAEMLQTSAQKVGRLLTNYCVVP